MESEKVLIVGGQGPIGSWISKGLLEDGIQFAIFDGRPDNSILTQVIDPVALPSFERVFGDLTDPEALAGIIQDRSITRLIHLAAPQETPSQRGQKPKKKPRRENLQSTFEAVRTSERRVAMVVYASTSGEGEEIARTYYRQYKIPSVGLRPVDVYGVGHEIGLMSSLTRAIKAAVLERSFTIPFRGTGGVAFVEDVARTFLAAVFSDIREALALEPRTRDINVETFIQKLEEEIPGAAGRIDASGEELEGGVVLQEDTIDDLPGSDRIPDTSLEDGIRRTAGHFRRLADEGRLRETGFFE